MVRLPVRFAPLLLSAAGILGLADVAWATGEVIVDVRVRENQRTDEETIRSIAGVDIGDFLEATTLEVVRERLNNAGLFSHVDVYWEKSGAGVRVNIVVKDKFPWAPVPTFSLSKTNLSLGLLFVHGNLFGRGKQMLVGGRYSTLDSGATLAYRDPAFLGTWGYWQIRAKFQDQVIPEFDPRDDGAEKPLRETQARSFGGEAIVGIAWWRKVKTQFGWHLEQYDVRKTEFPLSRAPYESGMTLLPDAAASDGAVTGYMLANLIFDFRAREHSITTGNALDFGLERATSTWRSDVDYRKASVRYEHYLKFGRKVNLVMIGVGYLGSNLPLWAENWSGGENLRGYLSRQFRGDTQVRTNVELHFPVLPAVKGIELRGLVFHDAAAIWFRDLPDIGGVDSETGAPVYQTREGNDARNYLPPGILEEGFDSSRDIHHAVGGGLRLFIRSLSVPLVGIDYGYGIESGKFRLFVVAGA